MENLTASFLDNTLRDDGYYNNWDFESDVVDRYLRSMQAASVDVIKIGSKSSFMRPYTYCTDEVSIVMKHGDDRLRCFL